MNRRQKKKHLKKAMQYAIFSFELADKYLAKYGLSQRKLSRHKGD